MSERELPPDFGRPRPMMVEALFSDAVSPDVDAIARRAAELAGSRTERIGKGNAAHGIAFPEHLVQFADASAPMTAWLMQARDHDPNGSWVEDALRQTWTWPDAELVVRGTTSAWLVTDMMAGPLDHRIRLRLYHAVLGAVVEITRPAALRWTWGQRFTQPEAYLADRSADPTAFESTINIRYVTIQDRPGEQLMDSVGMQPFGMPDVQTHYTNLDPTWVAAKLLGTARYIWDNGDVIEDGHTVPGLRDDERWPCHHEFALMEPERQVIDIDPSPYGPARSS